jgi:hypothetical protein
VSMTCTSREIWGHEFLLSYTSGISGIYFICDSSNRCHALIRHENCDAMVRVSALMKGIPPGRPPFLISSGGWMPLKRALAMTMASAFWWRITVAPKSLGNHRKNQEVGLLCGLFRDFVSLNFPRCTRHADAITCRLLARFLKEGVQFWYNDTSTVGGWVFEKTFLLFWCLRYFMSVSVPIIKSTY